MREVFFVIQLKSNLFSPYIHVQVVWLKSEMHTIRIGAENVLCNDYFRNACVCS